MNIFILFIFCAFVYSFDDTMPTTDVTPTSNYTDPRKHYGLSFSGPCKRYSKVFKCMNQCKSIGYQIHRLDRKCNCSCYQMKTSSILPYFRWKTNGTTKKVPKTHSPRLYDIVGTLSPFPIKTVSPTTAFTCPALPADVTSDSNSNSTGNETVTSSDSLAGSKGTTGNSDASGNATATTSTSTETIQETQTDKADATGNATETTTSTETIPTTTTQTTQAQNGTI